MNTIHTSDVQHTQDIVRKLNLKVTGWQFVQLAQAIGQIRLNTIDAMKQEKVKAQVFGARDVLREVKSDQSKNRNICTKYESVVLQILCIGSTCDDAHVKTVLNDDQQKSCFFLHQKFMRKVKSGVRLFDAVNEVFEFDILAKHINQNMAGTTNGSQVATIADIAFLYLCEVNKK